MNFNPQGNNLTLNSPGNDAFIAKYDPNFQLTWVNQYPALDSVFIRKLIVDDLANVFFLGEFANTVDIDAGSNTQNFTSSGKSDIFIGKINYFGDLIFAEKFGGIKFDKLTDALINFENDLIIGGSYQIQIGLDLNFNTITLNGPFTDNIFITKFNQGPLSIGSLEKESNLISVYPNPSSNTISIGELDFINSTNLNISIFSICGQRVYLRKNYLSNTIDISLLNPGMYVIYINANEKEYRGTFIKK